MKGLIWAGIVLVVLGILAFAIPRITYTEDVANIDIGPVEAEVEEERSFTVPNVVAVGLVVVGGGLIIAGAARRPPRDDTPA